MAVLLQCARAGTPPSGNPLPFSERSKSLKSYGGSEAAAIS